MYLILIVVFLLVVARLERRMVWPYGELDARPQFGDPNGYGARWVTDAVQAGFRFLGWAPDLKGNKYQVSYAMLVAPERDAFVIIGVGQIWGMSLAGTWLYTPSVDGQHLWYTTDNQSGIEIDISRCWKSQLVRAASFAKLWNKHSDWVQTLGATPHRFTFMHEVAEFRRFREEHYREMSRRGLVSFAENSESYWRYTVFGAVKAAMLNSSIGLLRGVTFGRIPRSA